MVRAYGYCELESSGVSAADGPIEGCSLGLGSYYLAALSWSVMVITGTGGTDFYPSSLSNAETLIVVTLVI